MIDRDHFKQKLPFHQFVEENNSKLIRNWEVEQVVETDAKLADRLGEAIDKTISKTDHTVPYDTVNFLRIFLEFSIVLYRGAMTK